jgi:hypothetical protein
MIASDGVGPFGAEHLSIADSLISKLLGERQRRQLVCRHRSPLRLAYRRPSARIFLRPDSPVPVFEEKLDQMPQHQVTALGLNGREECSKRGQQPVALFVHCGAPPCRAVESASLRGSSSRGVL